MILTPIALTDLDQILARFRAALPPDPRAHAVVERLSASRAMIGGDERLWHADAVALCHQIGMPVIEEPPSRAFSWDGSHVRTLTEPAVLIHEVAHYQVAPPARRFLPDFGLGAGPETGEVAAADRAQAAEGLVREREEQMASLLGILWELRLGQPGILAFLEQNWLEGAGRPGAGGFLVETLDRLAGFGLIDEEGGPRLVLRLAPDEPTC